MASADHPTPTPSSTSRIIQGPRLAEAPSRNEIALPPAAPTSQPPFFLSAPSHPALQRIPINSMNGTTSGCASSTAIASQMFTPNVAAISANRPAVALEDLEISSCGPNLLMSSPQNAPFNSPMALARRSGGGPKKKAKSTVKKPRATAQEKMLDDTEAVLANGNSPLYAHDASIILQHSEAQQILSSLTSGVELVAMSAEELKQTATDFKTDGIMGFNDPEYLSQAHEASQLRSNGEFDEMVGHKFDDIWGGAGGAEEYTDDEGDDPNTGDDSGPAEADGPSSMFPDNQGPFKTTDMRQYRNPGISQLVGSDDRDDDSELGEPEYYEPAPGYHPNFRRDDDDQNSGGASGSTGVSNGSASQTGYGTNESNNTYQAHDNPTNRHSSNSYSGNQATLYPSMYPHSYETLTFSTQDRSSNFPPTVHPSMLPDGSLVYTPPSMYDDYSISEGANLHFGATTSHPSISPNSFTTLGAAIQPLSQAPLFSGTYPDARSVYPTMQAVPRPPQEKFVKFISKLKLAELWRVKYAYISHTKEAPIKVGDVFRCLVSPTLSKDIILDGFKNNTAIVSVPPRGYQFSNPSQRADVKFPTAATLGDRICGPTMLLPVLDYVEGILPPLTWEKGISLIRNGQVIAPLLHSVRQSYHFSLQEELFFQQLRFAAGRGRQLSKVQADQGFAVIGGCLFQKFHQDANLAKVKDVIIDLGGKLNALLGSCGSEGSIIVLMDLRILYPDGCPHEMNRTLADAYNYGPDSFSTPYLRNLAASRGGEHHWSKGHGQLGSKALGFSWGGDTLKGAKFTKADTNSVANFHHDYLGGKRLHYPIPIHRGHANTFGIYACQYVWSGTSWILDVDGPAPRNLPPVQRTALAGTHSEVFNPPPQSGPRRMKQSRDLAQKIPAPPPVYSPSVAGQSQASELHSQPVRLIEDQLPYKEGYPPQHEFDASYKSKYATYSEPAPKLKQPAVKRKQENQLLSEEGYPPQPEFYADYMVKYARHPESASGEYLPPLNMPEPAPEPKQPASKRRREDEDENIDPALLGL